MAKKFNTMLGAGPGAENAPGGVLDAAIVAGADNLGRENPIHWIALEQINTNPFQPRLGEDEKHILGLAESILSMKDELKDTMGLQQIPMGRLGMMRASASSATDEVFEPLPAEILASRIQIEAALATGAVVQLAFGHSRWWAFTVLSRGVSEVFPGLDGGVVGPDLDADYQSMPLRLVWLDDRSMSDHAATENAQRKNISPLEEAIALHRRVNDLGMSQSEAGKPFGLSAVQVSNKLRLLRLPEDVQWKIQTGEISETHGRALLQLVNAPHLIMRIFEQIDRDYDGSIPTTRTVLNLIDRLIQYDTKILLDAGVVDEADADDSDDSNQMEWPSDWVPSIQELALRERGEESDIELVHGACGGCLLRVQLGKEKALRCTNTTCLNIKSYTWTAVSKAGQISLMMEKYGRDRVFDSDGQYRSFGRYAASAQLIRSGVCSMDNCSCMVLYYKSYWPDECERPHPEEAPSMVFACNDNKALFAKENALLADDGAIEEMTDAERERLDLNAARAVAHEENDNLAEAAIVRVVSEAGGLDELFERRGFLMSLADSFSGLTPKKDWTVEQLQLEIIRVVVKCNCRDWVTYSGEGAGFLGYTDKKIENFVRQATGRAKDPKPDPVDSSTWQDDWEEADDSEWLMIEGMGSSLVAELVTRAKCALRLVDRSEDKGERAKWWRRYNVLTNPAE